MDAAAWNERYRATELMWSSGPNRFVEEWCRDLQPGRSIDLAAGEGRNAIWLASRGWNSTAVDYSEVAIDRARRIAAERDVPLTTVVADLTRYEPTPGAYDLVVIAYLQIPDEEFTPVVRRAGAALAPGGRFVLVCHDRTNFEHGHGGPQYPEVLTSPGQVVGALGAGVVIDCAEVVERPVPTADGERIALDTLVVAHRPVDA